MRETCKKCGHNEAYYRTAQLRSADEGQTVFYQSEGCRPAGRPFPSARLASAHVRESMAMPHGPPTPPIPAPTLACAVGRFVCVSSARLCTAQRTGALFSDRRSLHFKPRSVGASSAGILSAPPSMAVMRQ